MSSCDANAFKPRNPRSSTWARAFGLAMAAGLTLTLGGCGDSGFRPMYASTTSNGTVKEKFAAVEIAPIGGKNGQRLRNELIFQSTGGGEPSKPRYRLEIVLREALGATLVKTTGEAASSIYLLEASFNLYEHGTRKVLLRGASSARAAFDRNTSIYANVRAAEDAGARAAKTMAEEISGRVAAFLSREGT